MKVNVLDREKSVFTVSNVLSPEECQELMAYTEGQGYTSAPITTAFGFQMRPEIRNNRRVMVDDEGRAQWLWSKVQPFLPATYHDDFAWEVLGLNERFRYYRYEPGQYFRWHFDGAYVRSPVQRSQLTLMVYLNDDFDGGSTDFDPWGSVVPERGMALVFDHAVWHQGAEVERGCKYVLRTDVMYRLVLPGEAR